MVTTETHQSQDLLVPSLDQENQDQENQDQGDQTLASALLAGLDLEHLDQMGSGSGPVNAITVLTLLDKLVHMLDSVQENQYKMEVHQVQMEVVVRGIQAEMTKLSKNQNHTNNNVSKLLEKSRKISYTMKEVRERMERQGAQVKKLEANHAHLVGRNGFKVLIFQEEKEIPASVFVKDPPPFPREEVLQEGQEPGTGGENQSEEVLLQPVDLSSDEEAGLGEEAEPEDEDVWFHDLENLDKSRTQKLKRSSLKKVDSLKKAFSRQNIEKKMTKIGTKIVSVEQREKIKQKTSSLKVPPISFSLKKPRADSAPAEEEVPLGAQQEVPITHYEEEEKEEKEKEEEQEKEEKEKSNEKEKDEEKEKNEEEKEEEAAEKNEEVEEEEEEKEEVPFVVEAEVSVVSEGVSEEYALSSTLPQEERRGGGGVEEE